MNMMDRIRTFFIRNPRWKYVFNEETLCLDCSEFGNCHNEIEWERYKDSKADEDCFKPYPEVYYK